MTLRQPASKSRSLLAAVVAAVVLAGTVSAPALAKNDRLKDKHRRAQQAVKSARTDLDQSSRAAYVAGTRLLAVRKQLVAARSTLVRTQRDLKVARAKDADLATQLVQAKQDLAAARAALRLAQADVVEQRAAVGRLAAGTVQNPDPRLVGMVALMNADDPTRLSTELQTVSNLLDRQDQTLDQLRQAESRRSVQAQKVAAATAAVGVKSKTAHDNVVRIAVLAADAKAQRTKVAALYVSRKKARRAADLARNADRVELRRLKREDARIRALIARKAGRAAFGNGGPLVRPVDGRVSTPFGWRIHPIFGYRSFHDGVDLADPCGTPIRAAGNGRVISEYYQTAWGKRLILDLGRVKGVGVTAIYNHMDGYRVPTGARVTRGEVIGYVGNTGWSTGCHVHASIMVNGVAKNPFDWF